MSAETIEGIRRAIEAHVVEVHRDTAGDHQIVAHWFVGYEMMQHDPNVDEGISYGVGYIVSPSSPSAATGCAELALADMKADLVNGTYDPECEEDGND